MPRVAPVSPDVPERDHRRVPRVAPVSPDVPERDHRVQHAVALVRHSASADRDQVQMSFSIVFDRKSALADIGRNISAKMSAENVSADFSCFGHLAKTALSAEITFFRPKLTCLGQNILNSWEHYCNFFSLYRFFRRILLKNSLSATL